MSMIQDGIYYNIKKKINNDFRSIKDEDIYFIFNYVDSLKKQINEIDKTKNDVTYKYENMIQSFECDFNIAFNYGDFTMFDYLKRLIENKNGRFCLAAERHPLVRFQGIERTSKQRVAGVAQERDRDT